LANPLRPLLTNASVVIAQANSVKQKTTDGRGLIKAMAALYRSSILASVVEQVHERIILDGSA
jgi:hypothetical protein